MKKGIKIALWVLLAIVAVLLVVGLVTPRKFDISRSALIKAERKTVWDQVSLWKNMNNWSPWYKMDTSMTVKLEGEDGKPGAKYSWESKVMGNGSQTILESRPMDFRSSDLVFDDWGGKSIVSFALKDSANATFITWRMTGENGFVGRIFSFFMGMNDAIGKDFEKGLADMKKICEAAPVVASYKLGEVETRQFDKRTFIAIRHQVSMDEFEKNAKSIFDKSTGELVAYTSKNNIQITGTLFGLYYVWDDKGRKVDMEIAFPVDKEVKTEGNIHTTVVNATKCAVIDYWGPYESSGQSHMKMDEWLKSNNKESGSPVMEEYITDPSTEKDPMKLLTRVWYPLK
jgi:effector-binding domain-containing protein